MKSIVTKQIGNIYVISCSLSVGEGLGQPEALNKKAIQIINRVRDKLTGEFHLYSVPQERRYYCQIAILDLLNECLPLYRLSFDKVSTFVFLLSAV